MINQLAVYIVAFFCVVGLAIGQILFKVGAVALSKGGSLIQAQVTLAILGAVGLYGVTSLAWIWVLQRVELGRVYPLMALAFVLVPIGSHLVFGEKFSNQYFFAIALILVGIVVAARA